MQNKLLRRLSVLILSITVCPLSLPNAKAADNAYSTASTTAVFAREVQVNTAAWWERGGSLLPGSSASPASLSPLNEVRYDRFSRIRPRAESLDVTLLYRLTDVVSLYGGGWFLSAAEPGSLKPRAAKFGLDFASPWLFARRRISVRVTSSTTASNAQRRAVIRCIASRFRLSLAATRVCAGSSIL